MKKCLILVAIFALLLCGCTSDIADTSSNESISSSIQSVESDTSSDTESSSDTNSSATTNNTSSESTTDNVDFAVPKIAIDNKYGDLLTNIEELDKSVVGYGELGNDEYKSSLEKLEKVLDGYDRNISVVVYSLNNTKALAYNTSKAMFCACTVKAPFSLFCCLQMDSGKAALETKMEYKYEHRDPDWGTGDMKFSKYGTLFDMRTIIHKSMSISDNVAYNMQVDYFDRATYNNWVKSIGAPSMQISPTVWSLKAKAKDLAISWREIYKYFSSDAEHAEFLLSTCTNTADNFATAELDVNYSHKQGFNGGDWPSMCDGGIVWNGNDSYVFAILTNNPNITAKGKKVMSDAMAIINNELM